MSDGYKKGKSRGQSTSQAFGDDKRSQSYSSASPSGTDMGAMDNLMGTSSGYISDTAMSGSAGEGAAGRRKRFSESAANRPKLA